LGFKQFLDKDEHYWKDFKGAEGVHVNSSEDNNWDIGNIKFLLNLLEEDNDVLNVDRLLRHLALY
jgi:hypothetical protein